MANPMEVDSGSDFIRLNVSNSKNDNVAFEIKFPKDLTVALLKRKLEIITGGNASSMNVQLYNGDHLVTKLDYDNIFLGSLPVENGMRLHVTDNFEWFTDEKTEKFELSEDQYETKGDTVRNFLKQNALGKYNEKEMLEREEKRRQQAELEQKKADLCTIGSRCQVTLVGNPQRRGTIMYNGHIENKKGNFIGVKYDEPLGKNDGSIDGIRYFTCPPKYGGFVSPFFVEIGDFPPEDDELDDEI